MINMIEWQTSIQGMSLSDFWDYVKKREESLELPFVDVCACGHWCAFVAERKPMHNLKKNLYFYLIATWPALGVWVREIP